MEEIPIHKDSGTEITTLPPMFPENLPSDELPGLFRTIGAHQNLVQYFKRGKSGFYEQKSKKNDI
jgi:hypothetical protein